MDKILMVIKLLPALIEAIKVLESLIPGVGQGEQKLVALRGILEAIDSNVKDLWPSIEKVVGVLVGVFNNTGVFKK